MTSYVEVLRAFCEDSSRDLPAGLITVLRIVRYLVVPPDHRELWEEGTPLASASEFQGPTLVKFNYALTEFYSREGLDLLMRLIDKLTNLLLVKWQQGLEHMDARYPLVLAALEPATAVAAMLLVALIRARDADFKDTTSLRPLFAAFIVVCSAPSSSQLPAEVGRIRVHLVEALLAFTRAGLPAEESDGALEGHLWTVMLRELLVNAVSCPYAFFGSMTLLSELLPLPLPVLVCGGGLSDQERRAMLTSRQLWSAHLLCVEAQLRECMQVSELQIFSIHFDKDAAVLR